MRWQPVGAKGREWARVWKKLKLQLECAGITSCEFRFTGCTLTIYLTPAHSRKRRKIETNAQLAEVAIACVNCHRILDEEMSHEEMERSVKRIIELRNPAASWKITN